MGVVGCGRCWCDGMMCFVVVGDVVVDCWWMGVVCRLCVW